MTKYYYTKGKKKNGKKIVRFIGLGISVFGFFLVLYIFTPLVLYQINFTGVYASQNIVSPIPKTFIVTSSNTKSVYITQNDIFSDSDYLNAQNWFPSYSGIRTKTNITSYAITIPKLGITNGLVSTIDDNLAAHLVNFAGTAVPPDRGTALVFGHSTLPELYKPGDYKTIFANILKMSIGDTIVVTEGNKKYTYRIYDMTIIEPDDLSVFAQNYTDSYFDIVTCVPPGTVQKRLVLKSRLINQS